MNLRAGGMQGCMSWGGGKWMLSLRVQCEMAKYRISQGTVGSTVQGTANDVRGLFLGNHRNSP